LSRLQAGEKDVEGYALFGFEAPVELLNGNLENDQLYDSMSRIQILREEIAFLDRIISLSRSGDLPQSPEADVVNGSFSHGLSGWTTSEAGYGGSATPQSAGTFPTNTDTGYLQVGVYGGSRSVYQIIPVGGLELWFAARFRIDRWSTFGGRDGGWVSVAVSFLDEFGETLGTTAYYVHPFADNTSRSGHQWIKLGTGTPTPSQWFKVESDLAKAAQVHGIEPHHVKSLRIGAQVFGTHEDRTHTVARFDDFVLTPVNRVGGSLQP
jgi:hypothetical protein